MGELKVATSSTAPTTTSPIDQAQIDEAVRAAVEAKEAELRVELSKPQPDVDARKAELDASYENRLKEALTAKADEAEKEKADLKKEIDELQAQVSKLSRLNKTADIARKTLERQKQEAEAKLKKVEEEHGGATGTPAAPASGPVASVVSTPSTTATPAAVAPDQTSAPVVNPFGRKSTAATGTTAPPTAPASTSSATASTSTPPTGPASATTTTATRGAARGREIRTQGVRGRGGRAANILSSQYPRTLCVGNR